MIRVIEDKNVEIDYKPFMTLHDAVSSGIIDRHEAYSYGEIPIIEELGSVLVWVYPLDKRNGTYVDVCIGGDIDGEGYSVYVSTIDDYLELTNITFDRALEIGKLCIKYIKDNNGDISEIPYL